MNEIAINALIERLLFHAACHGSVAQFDDEQKQWAEDLSAAAYLILNLYSAIAELSKEARAAEKNLFPAADPDGNARTAYGIVAERLERIVAECHKEPAP